MAATNAIVSSQSPNTVKVQPERFSNREHAGADRSDHVSPSQDGAHAVTDLNDVSSLGAAAAVSDASVSAQASGDEVGSQHLNKMNK